MPRTLDLFGPKPRAPRRVLMDVIDAGEADGRGPVARYLCRRCGHDTGWVDTPPGPRGGMLHHATSPCPRCNQDRSLQ